MKTIVLRGPVSGLAWVICGFVLGLAWVLGSANVTAAGVATLAGGNPNVKPKYLGYRAGDTFSEALFHTPSGLAIDYTGNYLFVADRDNNAIRYLDLAAGQTWTFAITTPSLISKPVGVVVDSSYN